MVLDRWIGVVIIALGGLIFSLEFVGDNNYNDGGFAIGGVILVLIGIGIFGLSTYSYYYATHFPRLVILDYLRGIL